VQVAGPPDVVEVNVSVHEVEAGAYPEAEDCNRSSRRLSSGPETINLAEGRITESSWKSLLRGPDGYIHIPAAEIGV